MEQNGVRKHFHTDQLDHGDQELLRIAHENLDLAYAPYSGFHVGVAIRTSKGHVASGANQENASYPLCMCGERVALYNSAILFPGEEVETIAIVVRGKKPVSSPAPPCGACLQVISEFEARQGGKGIRLLLKATGDEIWEVPSVRTLLPVSFDGSFL